jgi:hypothetical protein
MMKFLTKIAKAFETLLDKDKSDRRRIITVDFDGVIHSYVSGWRGVDVITDPPVDGAIEFLLSALTEYRVAIFSSRSSSKRGREAMQEWLKNAFYEWIDSMSWKEVRSQLYSYRGAPIVLSMTDDPDTVVKKKEKWAELMVNEIEWPINKPASVLTIDDRAFRFEGTWPTLAEIMELRKTWQWKPTKEDKA